MTKLSPPPPFFFLRVSCPEKVKLLENNEFNHLIVFRALLTCGSKLPLNKQDTTLFKWEVDQRPALNSRSSTLIPH